MGKWITAATIDGTDFCGPIPHQVAVEKVNGSKVLKMISGESTEGCSEQPVGGAVH